MGNCKAWRYFELQLYNITYQSSQRFPDSLWAHGEILEGILDRTINFELVGFLLQNVINGKCEVLE